MNPEQGDPGFPGNSPRGVGSTPRPGPHGAQSEAGERRPSPLAWASDELLARTRRVWSGVLGRPVGVEEAVEILTNVRHLAQALRRAKQGGGSA